MLKRLKHWAAELKAQVVTLWFCRRHPDTPWGAKVLAALIVAYAFSPIDLIPDFVPVLGYVDDLLLIPLGVYFTIRLIPPHVLVQARTEADAWLAAKAGRPANYWAAAAVVIIWIAAAYWAWILLRDRL
jgi:uncharacterized membrane protein YkvA (DUF1232 family)